MEISMGGVITPLMIYEAGGGGMKAGEGGMGRDGRRVEAVWRRDNVKKGLFVKKTGEKSCKNVIFAFIINRTVFLFNKNRSLHTITLAYKPHKPALRGSEATRRPHTPEGASQWMSKTH